VDPDCNNNVLWHGSGLPRGVVFEPVAIRDDCIELTGMYSQRGSKIISLGNPERIKEKSWVNSYKKITFLRLS